VSIIPLFGPGKTHLGVAILNDALDQKIVARFASAPEMMRAIESAAKSFDQFQHLSIVQQLTEIPILFIDDVDKVRPTDARQDLWFLIADQRYKAKQATILSTNKFDHLGHYIGCKSRRFVGENPRIPWAVKRVLIIYLPIL
jgi:DNA replication protein DnaC